MKINIGTTRGNIVGVEVDKDFEEITYDDIIPFIIEQYGSMKVVAVIGWAPNIEPGDIYVEEDDWE